MQPNQRMTDGQGNEVALFPMTYLHMSQGEHQQYALDFLGWNANGRVYDCPCYAPFSCQVTFTGNDHNMICQSLNPVRFVDGTLDYATVLVAHSMTAPASLGTVFTQGQLWYHTGNYGQSTGDHLHMEVAKGKQSWAVGGLHLNNPYHMWDMLATDDTVIDYGMGLNWRDYGGITPPTPTPTGSKKQRGFPWVLYARRLRQGL